MDKKKNHTIKYTIIILGCVAIIIGVFFLFRTKTTTTSDYKDQDSISPIVCKTTNPSMDSFFNSNASSSLYTIKYTYKNGKADKISFTYNGDYGSSEDARYAEAVAHANYNEFMSATSKSPESFSPSFSHTNSSMQINLFGEADQLTNQTAKLFYIDSDTFASIDFSSLEEVVKNYESKNFSCTFNK